jgi:hypothetical protein
MQPVDRAITPQGNLLRALPGVTLADMKRQKRFIPLSSCGFMRRIGKAVFDPYRLQ